MNNFEKMQLCYTDVLNAMCDLTNTLATNNDLNTFVDDLELIDKASIILKRMGDTVLIEEVQEKVGGKEE